jgi:type II secretion system protein L
MKTPAFTILLEPTEITVAVVALDGAVTTEVVPVLPEEAGGNPAPALREALGRLGYKGGGVCLGVSSAETFVAPIDCSNVPRNSTEKRQTLMFRLEEHLPIDAEEMTADFLPAAGGTALGVAVESAALARLVAQLSEAGVETAAICPTPLLALWESLREGQNTDAEYFLLAAATHVDVIRVAEGRPRAWHTTPPDVDEVVRAIKAEMLGHPGLSPNPATAVIGTLPAGPMTDVCSAAGLACRIMEHQSIADLAARAAVHLLEGEDAGWIDLRRDTLGHENPWGRLALPLKVAVIVAIVALVAVSAAAHLRAYRYDAVVDQALSEEAALHQKVFPNTRTPIDVERRLASETRRLEGLRGSAGAMPEPFSALDSFNQVVGSLPENLRIRIVDLRVDPSGILVEGQARSHADAEKFAQAIRATGRFVCDPPRSEQLVKGGVAFTLNGKPAPKPALSKAEGAEAAAKGGKP